MIAPDAVEDVERSLLEFARYSLGRGLSTLLLSGLGGPHDRARLFEAWPVGESRQPPRYRLRVENDSGEGLPGGRDPLVLLALLHRLWSSGGRGDAVSFREGYLPTLPGWEDTAEARLAVVGAVRRYYSASYDLLRVEVVVRGQAEVCHVRAQKLVTGYETEGGPGEARRVTKVQFHPGFYRDVWGSKKLFLRIDFEKLRLRQVPLDSPDLV
jgi:hypothetical protein